MASWFGFGASLDLRGIAAGAKFFQTRAVYDVNSFARFMKRVEDFDVPILAGIIPLKSAGRKRRRKY